VSIGVPSPEAAACLLECVKGAQVARGLLTRAVHRVARNGTPVSAGSIDWSLTKDGLDPFLNHGTAAIKDGRATVTGQLPSPGFLQCKVVFKDGTETVRGLGAAAVDPSQIKPSLPVPDDFDAFFEEIVMPTLRAGVQRGHVEPMV